MTSSTFPRRKVIAQACTLIEEWTGFALRETAPRRIAETFGRRAEILGYDDPMAYLNALRDLPSTAEEPQRLVNLITNGLTAFWRDDPQLSALRSVLQHLDVGPIGIDPIYVWCAGVSTGEEAYTVSMIADEESIPLHVLGTDVNTEFLDTARRGLYADWSLRRLDESRRDTYLTPVNTTHWEVNHDTFANVAFDQHNLLKTPPQSPHPDGLWDIILCRNVLIYFSSAATTTALRNMADALTDEGYLMFGSSEQIHPERLGPDAPDFRPIRQGGGFLYRPGSTRTGRTIEPGRWQLEPDDNLSTVSYPPSPTLSSLDETTSDVRDNNTVVDLLKTAAEHLDEGESELAIACLEASLGYDPFHVECYCLMGTILQSLGASQQAQEAFQKALFLQPNHWFAAHHTANIHEARGDIEAARRSFRRTLDSLDRPADCFDDTFVLRDVVGSVARIRHQARRQAEAFLRLHDSSP